MPRLTVSTEGVGGQQQRSCLFDSSSTNAVPVSMSPATAAPMQLRPALPDVHSSSTDVDSRLGSMSSSAATAASSDVKRLPTRIKANQMIDSKKRRTAHSFG